jgi:hypothetical protein
VSKLGKFYQLPLEDRVALTERARASGEPLLIRWADLPESTGELWRTRAIVAAAMLDEAISIVDLGCGTMEIGRQLGPRQLYFPVDVVARDDRTRVLDLNRVEDQERLPPADACVMLGVLEYIYQPYALFTALRRTYRQAVVSFNVRRPSDPIPHRLGHGWVNHFERDELIAFFERHGFGVRREHLFEGPRQERLFDLH